MPLLTWIFRFGPPVAFFVGAWFVAASAPTERGLLNAFILIVAGLIWWVGLTIRPTRPLWRPLLLLWLPAGLLLANLIVGLALFGRQDTAGLGLMIIGPPTVAAVLISLVGSFFLAIRAPRVSEAST
jgi:hypothetical protein